ncbi:MAG TPA: DUF2271 domain-containing protein [Burkholderiaceae bacterium]|nr:DUF2271 domain-containing protein [Burkholderiaceae bacterium]
MLKPVLAVLASGLFAGRAHAADMTVTLTIPRVDTAEYHRPYVAIWLEDAARKDIRDIAVWHERDKAGGEGKKWLKDLRQWWRLSGRAQDEPADGVSGATRASGTHTVRVPADSAALDSLAPGDYRVVVEAAREKGGHELVRLPLTWPPTGPETVQGKGSHELGSIGVSLNP